MYSNRLQTIASVEEKHLNRVLNDANLKQYSLDANL